MLHRNRRAGGQQGGFTLLELMIAVAILAVVLVWSTEATSRAIRAENHAKLMTTATFLARQVLTDLEDELAEKGIQDDAFATEKVGNFEESGFKRFGWRRIVDKITLPGQDVVQTALGQSQGGAGGGGLGSPLGGLSSVLGGASVPGFGTTGGSSGGSAGAGTAAGGVGSLIASQFGMVKDILEQAIRRVTVKVVWTENGVEQVVEVSEYLTDPRRVDQVIPGMSLLGGLINQQAAKDAEKRTPPK